MFFIKHRNVIFALAGAIVVGSIAAITFLGLPLSIEFTGGSVVEVAYTAEPVALETVKAGLEPLALGEFSLRQSGDQGLVLRSRTLSPEEHESVLAIFSQQGVSPITELRFNSIGPSLGTEMGIKALYAIAGVIIAIMLYIAWAFRKVSRPVSSWVYGGGVVLIMIHDIIVPTGFYAVWAYFTGAQVDTLFVVAILAILGYSVNDTIVIFDRVREHLKDNEENNVQETFDVTVGKSIMETLGRSINTSLTVILALLALIFVGSEATFNFALVLLVGVIAGTYSSILVAAPLLVPVAKKLVKKG
ncbi:protein translocase subunit SecF [Patescibacteria group bacterium]|nr:protein translocase subunit SecF [Patescibacteria group bacterium]MBU1755038.1 protein translocase subunit SecF [Patescibacteria group bacterium]